MGRHAFRRGLLLLGLLSGLPAAGQDSNLSPREIWPQATAASDSGDVAGAEKKVNSLLVAGKTLGIQRFPLYAESAASLARQSYKQGNAALSTWAMDTARKLDPVSPDVAFTGADLSRDQGQWGGVFQNIGSGVTSILSDYRAKTLSRADLTLTAAMALAAAAIIFALMLFLRYCRPAAHDFRESLSRKMHGGVATVVAFAILFLPLFFWLGPVWLLLYWFVLFFGYATSREKISIAIVLGLLALLPIITDRAAYRIAGVDSPVVRGSVAAVERSYHPDVVRRLQELVVVAPQDPYLHLLLGNLQVLQGDESDAASHYRRAIELNDRLAGAHLNIGNLHFLNNDFLAAISKYEKAAEIDSDMAIAYYNHSVASGELYKFDIQGQKLEEAKSKDKALIDRLVNRPTSQKIVMYEVPIPTAWAITDGIAKKGLARDLYGNYAFFAPLVSAQSALTIGPLAALLLALLLWKMKKGNGFAGACIKCGRTFCHRCKSSRESAIYCTQCIHIYLKRDGVSLDTKRSKLAEVQQHQTAQLRRKKIFTTFLPGSAQLLDGMPIRGLIGVFLFLLFVGLAVFVGRLAPIASPAETMKMVMRVLAIALAVISWLVISIPVFRQKVTA